MEDTLLLQKEVDKSVLYQGLTIPQAFHDLFFERISFRLAHGKNSCLVKKDVVLFSHHHSMILLKKPV